MKNSGLTHYVLLTILSCSAIQADNKSPLTNKSGCFLPKEGSYAETIALYWSKQSYDQLGVWLSKNIKESSDLNRVYQISENIKALRLKNAVTATRNVINQGINVNISIGDLLQVALYIEMNIKNNNIKNYFFGTGKTKLSSSIEVDPKNGNIIVYLDNRNSSGVGKGKLKNFNTSLLYNVNSPEIIATGFLDIPKKKGSLRSRLLREVKLMRKLGGEPGIVKSYSILNHNKGSSEEVVFAEKLYKGGAIRKILSDKTHSFTTLEKVKLAGDFISGLRSLHKNGIAHHDLHSGNYLVDVSTANGNREISGVITDFGRARYVKGLTHTNSKSGKSRHHSKRDIFKLGVALYALYHDKYIKHRLEYGVAHKAGIADRRMFLEEKNGQVKLAPKERFEYLILKMLNRDKNKIDTIDNIFNEIKDIEEKMRIHGAP